MSEESPSPYFPDPKIEQRILGTSRSWVKSPRKTGPPAVRRQTPSEGGSSGRNSQEPQQCTSAAGPSMALARPLDSLPSSVTLVPVSRAEKTPPSVRSDLLEHLGDQSDARHSPIAMPVTLRFPHMVGLPRQGKTPSPAASSPRNSPLPVTNTTA